MGTYCMSLVCDRVDIKLSCSVCICNCLSKI